MRVLIAEDDPVSRHLLEAFLVKWGYEAVAVTDGTAAERELRSDDAPRLAILDWMMPGINGIDICREVRRRAAEPYIYILLVTAKGQQEDVLRGLEAGADDYLAKPYDPPELRARLRSGGRMVELHAQLIAAREQLRVDATHDPLTGLWNRSAVLELLQKELARSEREKSSVAVILADVDKFKRINDTSGHLSGDAVLREVAGRLRVSLRPYDAIGRYGGEEFLVVAPGCDAAGAVKLAERLRASVGDTPVATFEGVFAVTLSLGVGTNRESCQADDLVRAADAALYRAKEAGRNRVEVAPA